MGFSGTIMAGTPPMKVNARLMPVSQSVGVFPGVAQAKVYGGTLHRNKDAGRPNFAGAHIHNGLCRTGIIGKQFLAGPVDLGHRASELASPITVAGTEGGVLVAALTDGLPIFFPEQGQRHISAIVPDSPARSWVRQRLVRGRFLAGTAIFPEPNQPVLLETATSDQPCWPAANTWRPRLWKCSAPGQWSQGSGQRCAGIAVHL